MGKSVLSLFGHKLLYDSDIIRFGNKCLFKKQFGNNVLTVKNQSIGNKKDEQKNSYGFIFFTHNPQRFLFFLTN